MKHDLDEQPKSLKCSRLNDFVIGPIRLCKFDEQDCVHFVHMCLW